MAAADAPWLLVVDDEPRFLTATAATFDHAGYRVRCARSRTDALRELGERAFALVFVDYRLGDEDGLSLIAEVATGRGSRCVLWSAALPPDVARAARSLGARVSNKLAGASLLAFVAEVL